MTNKEAIGGLLHIRSAIRNYITPSKPQRAIEALDLAIAALERDRWISVEERLPDNTEPVLATFDDVYLIAIYGNYMWSDVMTRSLVYPTHWMPLPEPPKEET